MPRQAVHPRTAATVYLILGVCALVVGVGLAVWPQPLAASGTQIADGKVVELRGNDQVGWMPVIEFSEPGGAMVRWSGGGQHKPAAYQVGAHVPMVYVTANPTVIAIAGFWAVYLPAAVAFALGVIFSAFGWFGRRATAFARAA
jgi:hypothetical protein